MTFEKSVVSYNQRRYNCSDHLLVPENEIQDESGLFLRSDAGLTAGECTPTVDNGQLKDCRWPGKLGKSRLIMISCVS